MTMAAEIDPRLKAIMDKLNKSPDDQEEDYPQDKKPESPRAPTTFEEFVEAENLDEWPYRITSEHILDLSEEKQCIGSVDDIKEELCKATKLDMTTLNNLENKLKIFEYQVTVAADQLIVDPPCLTDVLPLPMSVSRAFMTEAKEGDLMKVHPSRKNKQSEASDEAHRKSVDHCSFPGYRQGELTELPGQLEAPQILNRVTKSQDFNPGLRRFWKKIFQSEASVAMMQDAFWWIFIELFEKKRKKDQSRLFDRLADSFVALFTSINPEIKDKIFLMYADSLCQAIYVAFVEAFPESLKQLQDEFKMRLVNTVSEWITGVPPNYGSWNHWDMRRLQLPVSKPVTDSGTQVNGTTELALIEPKEKQSLPMADFNRTIQQLGSQPRMATVVSMATNNTALLSRDTVRMTLNTSDGTSLTVPGTTLAPLNPSRQTQYPSPKKKESSYMGRGTEVERVLFNLKGCSPLISHFLHMRQLRAPNDVGRKVRRTQVLKPPPETKTYQDLIQETSETQKKLSKEYTKICSMTQREINKIERHQRETSRKIEELQQSITHCHSSIDITLLKEKIFDSKDGDADGLLSSHHAVEAKAAIDADNED